MAEQEPLQSVNSQRKDPGFWRDLWRQARLVWRLILDPEVPFYLKILPLAALVYVVLPFDFIPDLAPVLGQLDDVTAVFVGMKVFIELTPPHIVARHLAILEPDGADDNIVEGTIIEEDAP